jgi:murein endopeptidase
MAWRRGEIWLDTDVLWFHERSSGQVASLALHAPAFFGLARGTVPAIAVPNGLAASRQRRAELRGRRNARKTRTAALVIGPAVMLTVVAPRLGAGARAGGALEADPPSLTFRLGPTGPEVSEEAPAPPAGRPARVGGKPAPQAPPASTAARATPFPDVHWHRATSRGLPYSGSLTAGTQLPIEGRDWVTWNPVADNVPNQPRRLYGNEHTIRTITSVLAAYRVANPHAPRVVVGDISFRGGGPMEQHRSHQNGLDVDLYYPRLDRVLRAPVRADQVDRALTQDLLDRFVGAGAQKVFVGHSTGLRGPGTIVIPYPHHEDHMHVRFRPPSG